VVRGLLKAFSHFAWEQDYSCGYSSGFTPDSLLFLYSENTRIPNITMQIYKFYLFKKKIMIPELNEIKTEMTIFFYIKIEDIISM